jgi:hypothetical protein
MASKMICNLCHAHHRPSVTYDRHHDSASSMAVVRVMTHILNPGHRQGIPRDGDVGGGDGRGRGEHVKRENPLEWKPGSLSDGVVDLAPAVRG